MEALKTFELPRIPRMLSAQRRTEERRLDTAIALLDRGTAPDPSRAQVLTGTCRTLLRLGAEPHIIQDGKRPLRTARDKQ